MENIEKNKTYILIAHIETRFGDPISSININSNYCVIGTMLGRLLLFDIKTNKLTLLLDGSDEEILNINFATNNNRESNDFYCCIGDSKILKYSIKQNLLDNNEPIIRLVSTIKNYSEEYLHIRDCDNAIVYLTKDIFFMVAIEQIKKKPMILNTTESNYLVKSIESQEIIESGTICTTNYIVPFDFDGKYFILLQFLTNVERMLFSFNVFTQKAWKHLLKENFGILNYCKLIKDNKLFIVRNLNQCEFRKMDDNFSITDSFKNIGDQVIACNLFYNIKRETKKAKPLIVRKEGEINIFRFHKDNLKKCTSDNNKEISDTVTKKNNNMNNSQENFKNIQSNDLYYENESNIIEENGSYKMNEEDKQLVKSGNVKVNSLLNIFLLDIDGNINYYNEKEIKTIFNINNVKEIDKIIRERGLFSLNYSYIIKYNHPYIAISTDNGCYIFQLKQN